MLSVFSLVATGVVAGHVRGRANCREVGRGWREQRSHRRGYRAISIAPLSTP